MDSVVEYGSFPPERPKHFSIVGSRETDSLGTDAWRSFLDKDRLNTVWSPPEGSPYRQFRKTATIDSIAKYPNDMMPRYSEGEKASEDGIDNLIQTGALGNHTAVVLDSGGAHSVAMAVALAKKLGYQPVIMFDAEVHPQGKNYAEQELATLLYFSQELEQLKVDGKIKKDAPPVFALDTHRNDSIQSSRTVDNTYTYKTTDFPDAQTLREQGITNIVYLNEADQDGCVRPFFQSLDRVNGDLKPVVRAWEQSGIPMSYSGVSPWESIQEDTYSSLLKLDSDQLRVLLFGMSSSGVKNPVKSGEFGRRNNSNILNPIILPIIKR